MLAILTKIGSFIGVRGFIALGLAIALGLSLWRIDTIEDRLEDAHIAIVSLSEWQSEMVQTVKLATGQNSVSKITAKGYVQELGYSNARLKNSIENQNKAIEQLEIETIEALIKAEKAEQARQSAIKMSQKRIKEFRVIANDSTPPKDMEKAVREIQDKLYDGGH